MLPVIAIVGRPNVGKSTLFNRLTKSRDALVADAPGLTRDRQYGEGVFEGKRFIVIDTGGIEETHAGLNQLMLEQAKLAMLEADIILFMVDGRSGRTAADEAIAAQLRSDKKTLHVLVNKVDGINPDLAVAEFFAMGLGEIHSIAAAHGQGVTKLLTNILAHYEVIEEDDEDAGTKIAIVGKPNVGKSTLVNRFLGEDRVIVFDEAGTTRDSIFIPFTRRDQKYTLIDTAGVRRKSKVHETVEKFSVIKTLKAIEAANVVIFVIDARENIAAQDLNLLGFILDAGKSLVFAVNKWDGLDEHQRTRVKEELRRRLNFFNYVKTYFISALHGTNVGHLFSAVDEAYAAATKELQTTQVTKVLEKAIQQHQPPLVHGRRIKLRYAHVGGHNPPIIVIHGNQTKSVPMAYKRYLVNTYRKAFDLVGTPLRLQFKDSENPYKDKKNVLSDRQKKKRKRMFRHVKK